MAQKNSAPFDKFYPYFIFQRRMVEFGNQEENKMKNGQTSNQDPEMTIIDGMPASILTGTDHTPAPWEE